MIALRGDKRDKARRKLANAHSEFDSGFGEMALLMYLPNCTWDFSSKKLS
jgi:hypothetical protein